MTIEAPKNGVKIRMYRQGHGDCFLLTFRKEDGSPFHMLIDCGIWGGSEIKAPIEDVMADLAEATGGHLDILAVTHEHTDHANMFTAQLDGKPLFDAIKSVDRLWLGWTANRADKLANKIRAKHAAAVKKLSALINRLRAAAPAGMSRMISDIDDLLVFEGIDPPHGFAAGKVYKPKVTSAAIIPKPPTGEAATRLAMDYVFSRVDDEKKRTFMKPHEKLHRLASVPGVNVFALGPPRDADVLDEDEPKGAEKGRLYDKEAKHGLSFGFASALDGVFGAADALESGDADPYRPFHEAWSLKRSSPDWRGQNSTFFNHFLPREGGTGDWRAIDHDWLFALDWFARKLNVEVNNSSLVLAIEFTTSGKVLIFAGDAQYGNWVSWADKSLPVDGGEDLAVKDLMARTVFYKVGHHGSHNATLKGEADSDYPNLSWMAQGDYENEFVAAIPANEPWARLVRRWPHPLKSIRTALDEKAAGRVFQSDIDFAKMSKAAGTKQADWSRFAKRATGTDLYFDYWVPDE